MPLTITTTAKEPFEKCFMDIVGPLTKSSNGNKKKESEKETHDKKITPRKFKVGDKVLLHDESVRRGRTKKLEAPWVGPYKIIELENVNAVIKKGRTEQKVHLNRLKSFYE